MLILCLVSESDADVVCQAGVTWNHLNETLREKGMSPCDRYHNTDRHILRHSVVFSGMYQVKCNHFPVVMRIC
jgi:hypothetical protein